MKYLISILCLAVTNYIWSSDSKEISESIVSIAASGELGETETELVINLAETLYEISGKKYDKNELRTKLEKYGKSLEKRKIEEILDESIKGIHRDRALVLLRECAARLKGTVIASYEDSEVIVLTLKNEDTGKAVELEATILFRDDYCVGFDHGFNYTVGFK